MRRDSTYAFPEAGARTFPSFWVAEANTLPAERVRSPARNGVVGARSCTKDMLVVIRRSAMCKHAAL
jgi:hypothetical protein